MPNDYLIRPATNDDAEAIRRVVFNALREHGLTPAPDSKDSDLSELDAAYFQNGGAFEVLTNSAGEVVGTVGIARIDATTCELRKMYLVPECRGRGFGKQLLQRAIDRARELGFTRMELETHSSLAIAARLYESFGFRPFTPAHPTPRHDRAYYFDLTGR